MFSKLESFKWSKKEGESWFWGQTEGLNHDALGLTKLDLNLLTLSVWVKFFRPMKKTGQSEPM